MKSLLISAVALCSCAAANAAQAAPKVVVSIKPIASLVAGVMAGVGQPNVVVDGGQSLHTFSMKPSDAKALNEADVVFWVGEGLETFLEKPIRSLSKSATVIAIVETPGLRVLKGREGGVWDKHDHDHDGHHDHDDHEFDGHVWLDPANAKLIVGEIERGVSKIDAANAGKYKTNAAALVQRIDSLDVELQAQFAPIKDKPFVVFHDGYQYLESRYGLNAVGSITVNPERMPGAKRVAAIKQKVNSLKAACVFAEPQFEPKLIQTLIEGTAARTGTLDPEGSTLVAGEGLYFELMRSLGKNLTACFAGR